MAFPSVLLPANSNMLQCALKVPEILWDWMPPAERAMYNEEREMFFRHLLGSDMQHLGFDDLDSVLCLTSIDSETVPLQAWMAYNKPQNKDIPPQKVFKVKVDGKRAYRFYEKVSDGQWRATIMTTSQAIHHFPKDVLGIAWEKAIKANSDQPRKFHSFERLMWALDLDPETGRPPMPGRRRPEFEARTPQYSPEPT